MSKWSDSAHTRRNQSRCNGDLPEAASGVDPITVLMGRLKVRIGVSLMAGIKCPANAMRRFNARTRCVFHYGAHLAPYMEQEGKSNGMAASENGWRASSRESFSSSVGSLLAT